MNTNNQLIHQILVSYQMADRSRADARGLVSMIQRYALPWSAQPSLYTFDASRVAPHLYYKGVLRADEANPILHRVRKMAERPQFYRLNYIRQLSTTSMAINLDANHNRLSHSLGTLDIASRFVKALQKNMNTVEQKAVLVHAFIHDCFHGPMGHTMDLIKDVIWGPRVHERIDKHLLIEHIGAGLRECTGFVWDAVLEDVADSETECKKIFTYLSLFLGVYREDESELEEKRHFLAEIVDSELDADRLDYIWRDQVHLMEYGIEPRSIENVVESVVVHENGAGEKHLYYDKKYAEIAEDLLNLRVKFYNNFYEHPLKLVSDEMLVHALYYILEEEGMLSSSGELTAFREEFASGFAFLTDDGLFHWLTEVTAKDIHAIPFALFQDFRSNHPFEVIYKRGLHRQNFPNLTRRIAALQVSLKRILDGEADRIRDYITTAPLGLSDRREYMRIIKKFNDAVAQEVTVVDNDPLWKDSKLPYTDDEDIYRLQLIYGKGFRKKLLLERLLWREIQKHPIAGCDVESALVRMARSMAQGRTADVAYVTSIYDKVKRTPLVFINLSWIPGNGEQELLNHKRGLSRSGLRFHDGSKTCKLEVELDVKSRDEDYLLNICAPRQLLATRGIEETIKTAFDRLLNERVWMFPEALE